MLTMKVTHEPHEHSESNEHIMKGAGLLLFTRHNGEIHFVLAREAYGVSRQMLWSGFEGRSRNHESDKETAAREFIEESLGVVKNLSTVNDVIKMIDEKDYYCKICLQVEDEHGVSTYTTFAKEIEYDSYLPTRFINARRALRFVSTLSKKIVDESENSTEHKKELQQFYASQIEPSKYLRDLVSCTLDEKNVLTQVTVKNDYFEKDMIDYWGMKTLEYTLSNNLKNDNSIKPLLIPTLYVAIREIQGTCSGFVIPDGNLTLTALKTYRRAREQYH